MSAHVEALKGVSFLDKKIPLQTNDIYMIPGHP